MSDNFPRKPPSGAAQTLKAVRYALGLSLTDMGQAMGLLGDRAGDNVLQIEQGQREITGPMRIILNYMAQAVDIEKDSRENDLVSKALPKWLDCINLEDESDNTEIIMHTRWPRFYALHIEDLSPDLQEGLRDCGIPVTELREDLGLGHLCTMFIDRPTAPVDALLMECKRLKERQAMSDLDD
jgi:transcriptional regulator with XRE-family HTH domain